MDSSPELMQNTTASLSSGGTRTKRRTPTQCTKFDILVPKLKRQKSQSSVTDVGGIVLDTSPHYKYTDCSDGNTQWPASPTLDDKRSSALNHIATSYRPVEVKTSPYSDDYRALSSKGSMQIHSCLKKGGRMCWLENSTGFYLFDFETMQLHNINTGYRRSIRFGGEGSSLIDLTDDTNAPSSSDLSSVNKETECGITTTMPKKQAAGVCGPAFEGGWLCGRTAEKKLAELREVNLQRSPLVSEM